MSAPIQATSDAEKPPASNPYTMQASYMSSVDGEFVDAIGSWEGSAYAQLMLRGQPPSMVQPARTPIPTGPPDAEPEDDPEEEPPPEDDPEDGPEEDPPDDVLPDVEPEDDPDDLPDDDPEEEDPDDEPDPLVPPPSSVVQLAPVESPQAPMAGATASVEPMAINVSRFIEIPPA
jgi:hypothetical protein